MTEPVVLYQHTHFLVATFGGKTCEAIDKAAEKWLRLHHQRPLTHLITPPSKRTQEGFQTILHAHWQRYVKAEGMIIKPGATIGIFSNDCAIAVAFNRDTEVLAATHTGREALTRNPDCPACGFTIISSLLNKVAPSTQPRDNVEIYVTASICGVCFQHNHESAQGKIAPFRKTHPSAIVGNHGLDQFEVIKQECICRGVKTENISHDGCCTKEHDLLSSYRNGDTNPNLTVIMRFP